MQQNVRKTTKESNDGSDEPEKGVTKVYECFYLLSAIEALHMQCSAVY
jgi:hypothetical protein